MKPKKFKQLVRESCRKPDTVMPRLTELMDANPELTESQLICRLIQKERLTPPEADRILKGLAEDRLSHRFQINLEGKNLSGYKIARYLGGGTFGGVFLAKRGAPFAVKVVVDRGKAKQEAGRMQNLSHPNIVRMEEASTDGELAYLVMEYVKGGSLDKVNFSGNWGQVIAWMRQLTGALQHLHEQGLFHGDLKPANFLIAKANEIKLADFGTAVSSGIPEGSRAYSAPEQILGNSYDARSELYSLGASFYRHITGKYPHKAESPSETLAARMSSPAAPPKGAPDSIATLLMNLLEENPDARPANAAALLTTLETLQKEFFIKGGILRALFGR